ncbi:2019_t:CDS:2, partial [Cetraspora pellucida]
TRKTLSYQKRQMFTNVCCITLCPFLMVAIAGIMGIVVQTLIRQTNSLEEFVFCSSANAESFIGIPLSNDSPDIPTLPSDQVPNSSGKTKLVKLVNYFLPPADPSTLSLSSSPQSCVFVFGHDYPAVLPYQPPVASTDNSTRRDTQIQTYPWFNVREAPGLNVGLKPLHDPLSSITNLNNSNVTYPGDFGILGNINTNYY